jgi:hypothetical protein
MTIEQKLISKLEPHSKRIKDGDGNDFDYLPAVLLHVIEEQKCQAELLSLLKKSTDDIEERTKEQISALAIAHSAQGMQTNEDLRVIASQIELFLSRTQHSHTQLMRLMIAGLAASTMMIGLAIVILQRQ